MKANWFKKLWLFIVLSAGSAEAQTTNSWDVGSGKWEAPGNWNNGAPSGNNAVNFIWNATIPQGGGVTTVDATTAANSSVMTISNLLVGAGGRFGTSPHTLFLNNAGTITPLRILHSCTIGTGGALLITNSLLWVGETSSLTFGADGSVEVDSNGQLSVNGLESVGVSSQGTLTIAGGENVPDSLNIGDSPGSIGTVWVRGGALGGGFITIGNGGVGSLTQSNGIVYGSEEDVAWSPDSQGTLTVAGGDHFPGSLYVGFGSTGTVWVTGGRFVATNASSLVSIGYGGVGSLMQSNGLMEVFGEIVGEYSQGTLTVAGGTHLVGEGGLSVGFSTNGTVWVTGGQLLANDDFIFTDVGSSSGLFPGVGSLTQSNGIVEVFGENVGSSVGSQGTLTVAGGTHLVGFGGLAVGSGQSATGTVWVTGGQLVVPLESSFLEIGAIAKGVGSLTQSNGTVEVFGADVGGTPGSLGTLTMAGGLGRVYSSLTIGSSDCTGTGKVIVAGGSLLVTNAAHNAVLDLESGTLTLSAGTLMVDVLVKTNPCASFIQTGGTLVVGGVTNPSASLFSITAISRVGNDMRVTWQTPGGVTNIVQANNGGSGGSYNTNFVDLPPQIIITGPGLITTNYTDVGGATNKPARYYRVRLVP